MDGEEGVVLIAGVEDGNGTAVRVPRQTMQIRHAHESGSQPLATSTQGFSKWIGQRHGTICSMEGSTSSPLNHFLLHISLLYTLPGSGLGIDQRADGSDRSH